MLMCTTSFICRMFTGHPICQEAVTLHTRGAAGWVVFLGLQLQKFCLDILITYLTLLCFWIDDFILPWGRWIYGLLLLKYWVIWNAQRERRSRGRRRGQKREGEKIVRNIERFYPWLAHFPTGCNYVTKSDQNQEHRTSVWQELKHLGHLPQPFQGY